MKRASFYHCQLISSYSTIRLNCCTHAASTSLLQHQRHVCIGSDCTVNKLIVVRVLLNQAKMIVCFLKLCGMQSGDGFLGFLCKEMSHQALSNGYQFAIAQSSMVQVLMSKFTPTLTRLRGSVANWAA